MLQQPKRDAPTLLTSLVISAVLAIGIVALLFWLGSLVPPVPESDPAFWIAASLSCPHCKKPYDERSFITTFCVMSEPPSEGGAQFRCLACLEIADFIQDVDGPQLMSMVRQQRHCETCGDCFLGYVDMRCSTCGSTTSHLAPFESLKT